MDWFLNSRIFPYLKHRLRPLDGNGFYFSRYGLVKNREIIYDQSFMIWCILSLMGANKSENAGHFTLSLVAFQLSDVFGEQISPWSSFLAPVLKKKSFKAPESCGWRLWWFGLLDVMCQTCPTHCDWLPNCYLIKDLLLAPQTVTEW